jgi:dCTP deaminase
MTTLTDLEIEAEVRKGRLITAEYEKNNLHQACYELRMGNVYYDLTEGDARIEVQRGKKILIKPLHRVVLITKEDLSIPANMLARITSKGSLFSVGLSPVSTYADPGFSGQIGIVTQNISDKYIELPIGEPVAKIEFSLLSGAVDKPYQGQHGFQTHIWPIKHQLQRTYDDVKNDSRVRDELAEAYQVTPAATVRLLKYMHSQQRWVLGVGVLSVVSNVLVLIFASVKAVDAALGLLMNLVASALIAGLVFFRKPPWER